MRGRQLATIRRIIAIVSPDSEESVERLRSWATDHDVEVATVDVGNDVDTVYQPSKETLGVSIGGDGTFLEGIKQFAPRNIPLLGINTGSLAFLVRVDVEDIEEALTEVIRGRATIDERQQLAVDVDGEQVTGINDVMIENVPPEAPVDRKIVTLEVFADGEFVGEYEGNGIAVSTPTGSTGVSLSADGPIHYPKDNETLQLVPLHTHKMGSRPLVFSSSTEILVRPEQEASLLVDGGRYFATLSPDQHVSITGSLTPAYVVRTSTDDHFFRAISQLLGWGLRDGSSSPPTGGTDDSPTRTVEQGLQVAKEAARSVGQPLRELHGNVQDVQHKSDKSDVVTEADFISENIITTAIENEFPNHNIRSEESVRTDTESEYTWIIDPLDGTGNYANGNPNYAVSIALLKGDRPILGVVYAPEMDEMFTAIRDGGASRDGHTISTTNRTDLAESVLLSGYDPDGQFLSHFYKAARGVRRLGSASLHLCYLASGSTDAVWEYDTYPWDTAAGTLIAREAGATLTDSTGREYEPRQTITSRNELVGSNSELHDVVLDHLNTNEVLSSD